MKLMVRLTMLLLTVLLSAEALSAQDSAAWAPPFHLQEGIYLDYFQFRENRPVPRSAIVSDYDTTRLDFLRQVTSAKTVSYRAANGKVEEVSPSSLWGFCENNSLYVRFNGDFNKIMVTGSICHFTAMYTTYMSTGPTMGGPNYGTPVQSMQQYIFDTESGRIYDFNLQNMEFLLSRDQALYAEFMNLRKSKRKKMMFFYLRKYNEKHLVYFRH
jgi:hypothetical protein